LAELNRQDQIHEKGFEMMGRQVTEYGKIKVGTKSLEDAVLNLGSIQKVTQKQMSKMSVYRALMDNDIVRLREISDYFYRTSGIYQRVCNYFATMYRYDWYVVPEIFGNEKSNEKIMKDFAKVLNYLDNSHISKVCADIALGVIKNGAYYGYVVDLNDSILLQELPVNYCRARYNTGGSPAVEFNMRFFDVAFPDTAYRMQVLNLFPDEFKKGYVAYKSGKLNETAVIGSSDPVIRGCSSCWQRENGWWLLDPEKTVKFSFNNGGNGAADIPLFINAIPAILDLDAAQDLDRRKQM
jgi:hypothetical protein